MLDDSKSQLRRLDGCGIQSVMKLIRTRLLVTAGLLAVGQSQASATSRQERWLATSTTASSITGDISLSSTQLQMAGHALRLRAVADMPNFEGDLGGVAARVLAVVRPSELRLLNGNRFGCGKPIRWIVVWRQDAGQTLAMDTFMGQKMPTSVHSGSFCASYFYSRG